MAVLQTPLSLIDELGQFVSLQNIIQGGSFNWTPPKFLSTGSHENWTRISLSVSSCKRILYLENLGGDQLKEPPCKSQTIRARGLKF